MITIGIDYTAAYEQTAGIGRLVRHQIAALAQEDTDTRYKLFVSGYSPQKPLPLPPDQNFQWYPTRITPLWFARLWYRARLFLPVEGFVGRVNLYHATDFTLPPHLPFTKTILTVHDLSFVRAPETTHPVLKRYLDRQVPWSVRRAEHVIADSQATKDDLIDLYQTPPEKISVVLSGVDPNFQPIEDVARCKAVRAKYKISNQPYIFSIGTVQPRKNYERIIQALHQLGEPFQDVQLVIAGGKGWLDNPIYKIVEDLKMQDRVIFTGFADDEDIPALYSEATVTAYPSLYEGFGFPILESMACGTPVLTSHVSSMPEVAGDAALMCNPYEVEAMAEHLRTLLTDQTLRETLIKKGFEQAKHFTWQQSARQLKAVYEQVLST